MLLGRASPKLAGAVVAAGRHGTGGRAAAASALLAWTKPPVMSLQELACQLLLKVMSGILVIKGMWQVGCLSRSFIHSAHGQAIKVLCLFIIVMSKGSLSFCLNSSSFGTL